MKVELEKLRLNISPLTDEVYVGTVKKNSPEWINKHAITNDFLSCVITRWNGYKESITVSDGKTYEISVKELKKKDKKKGRA